MNRTTASPTPTEKAFRRLLALVLFPALVLPLAAQTAGSPNVTLSGHVIKSLANATRLPHTPQMDEEPITLAVVLSLSDQAGAKELEEEIADPNSPSFRQTISANEFTARFGPTQEAYDAVLGYLEQNGFSLSLGSLSRRTLTVRGTRAQAQMAFQVAIDDYQLGDRTFHAIASDPAVPATIAPLILSVSGLSNLARMQPANGPNPQTPMSIATAYNGTLTPAGKANTGGLPPGLDGAGQTVGLIEFDGFDSSDVSNWLHFAGLPASFGDHVSVVPVAGGTSPSGCTQNESQCGTTEVMIDIEAALGLAQGANIQVFEAPQGTQSPTVIAFAGDTLSSESQHTISTSWYECEGDIGQSEATGMDSILSGLAASGVTVFAATADHGANCDDSNGSYPGAVAFPADASHAVAVGGTTLNVNPDNTYNTESWWQNSGGFGVSQFILPAPSYQLKISPGLSGRSLPDVSMEASPSIIVCQATASLSPDCGGSPPVVWGGTSLAAPLFAATWAIAAQAAADAGDKIGTAADGFFYTIPNAFHAPSTMTGPGNNFAHLGLGSPNMTKLVANIVHPRIESFSPGSGPAAGGTKVTIKGSGFIGVEKITFGGVAGTHLNIDSDTKLTVDAPVAPGEKVTIELKTPGGTATAAGSYDYVPEITRVNPGSGPMEGGTIVTVTGLALAKDETFVFGAEPATKLACSSSTSCTMTNPAHAPGTVDVQAQTTWGAGSLVTSASHFTYQSPAITGFSPSVGPTAGGMSLVLSGTSLENGKTTVTFGDVNGTGVSCPFAEECLLTTPPHAAGKVHLTVTVDGITSAPSTNEFTFVVFPTVTGISPSSADAGAVVTLTGTSFSTTAGQTTFTFFGIPVAGTCSSTTQCTAVVPFEVDGTAQTTAVPVTVNGITSLDYVVFSYKNKIPVPPCKGHLCS